MSLLFYTETYKEWHNEAYTPVSVHVACKIVDEKLSNWLYKDITGVLLSLSLHCVRVYAIRHTIRLNKIIGSNKAIGSIYLP